MRKFFEKEETKYKNRYKAAVHDCKRVQRKKRRYIKQLFDSQIKGKKKRKRRNEREIILLSRYYTSL